LFIRARVFLSVVSSAFRSVKDRYMFTILNGMIDRVV